VPTASEAATAMETPEAATPKMGDIYAAVGETSAHAMTEAVVKVAVPIIAIWQIAIIIGIAVTEQPSLPGQARPDAGIPLHQTISRT
jgi:hypothetical protein